MDDPWGSPWTSNNDDFGSFASAPPGPASASGSLSPGPKPPRPALLAKISSQDLASDSLNSNSNSNSKPPTLSFSSLEPSPWADDDNFGDWAAADSGSLGWGSTSFNDDNDKNKLSPRPNRSPQRSPQLSPVPWATAMTPIARPPGALTPRSRASSTMSRSSDPWGRGVDVSFAGDVNGDKTVDDADVYSSDRVDKVEVRAEEDYDTESESRTESHVDTDHGHGDDHPTGDHDSRQQVSPTTSVEEEDSENNEDEESDENNEGNDTGNDLELENSQDKSDGPNYPALRRKPSSKVQGLVELYDGLAKRPISASGSLSGSKSGSRSASATRSVSATRSASATRSMERRPSRQLSIKDLPGDDVDEELEDTAEAIEPVPETAEEAVEALPETAEPSAGPSPVEAPQIVVEPIEPTEATEEPSESQLDTKEVAPAQPETEEVDKAEKVKDAKEGKEGKEDQTANSSPITPADALLALYGRQEPYAVDTAKVDALFPILPKPRVDDGKDDVNAFIPDGYILDDSFTNISERRTWYRIARHGSSRKHNAGGSEDDNYRPVTWATSTVLPETVKIVRRWMEEDSFTGKPTLGAGLYSGGARGTNMFGWDSAAEPVTLDQVFKRTASLAQAADTTKQETKGHAHSRTLSNTQSAFGWGSDALLPASQALKKESVRHSVHFGGFPSLSSFGGEGENVWAPEGDEPDKPVSPLRQSFDMQSQGQNETQNGDHQRGHKSTPSIGSLPPPPKLVPRPSPLSINTVVSKPSEAAESEENGKNDDEDDDDDDEWGEMVMSPTAGESSLPPPMPMPVTASIQQAPILSPPPAEPVEPLEVSLPASFSIPFAAPAPPKTVSFQEHDQKPFEEFFQKPFSEKSTSDDTSFVDSIISSLPDLSYMAV